MHVDVRISEELVVCRPAGTLDAYTAPRLREAMALMTSTRQLLIDLSDVSFIDSAALAALVSGIRRVRDGGGRVAVCSARTQVKRVLEAIGFERVVPMVETIDDGRAVVTGAGAPPLADVV